MDTWQAVDEERSALADVKVGPFLAGVLTSGLRFNRYNARQGLAVGAVASDALLGRFKKTIGTHRTPPGANPENMLTDLVCHCGDIRRPTGTTRVVPEATLITVADMVKSVGFPLQAKKRVAGLRLSGEGKPTFETRL